MSIYNNLDPDIIEFNPLQSDEIPFYQALFTEESMSLS